MALSQTPAPRTACARVHCRLRPVDESPPCAPLRGGRCWSVGLVCIPYHNDRCHSCHAQSSNVAATSRERDAARSGPTRSSVLRVPLILLIVLCATPSRHNPPWPPPGKSLSNRRWAQVKRLKRKPWCCVRDPTMYSE
eukprot:6763625-Prymnesium_polylepis.1